MKTVSLPVDLFLLFLNWTQVRISLMTASLGWDTLDPGKYAQLVHTLSDSESLDFATAASFLSLVRSVSEGQFLKGNPKVAFSRR
jgi:hypothetical protein